MVDNDPKLSNRFPDERRWKLISLQAVQLGQELPISGNCIQVRAALGTLTITTNKGDKDQYVSGEVGSYDNPFQSIKITSTNPLDNPVLSIGYGKKWNPLIAASVALITPIPLPVDGFDAAGTPITKNPVLVAARNPGTNGVTTLESLDNYNLATSSAAFGVVFPLPAIGGSFSDTVPGYVNDSLFEDISTVMIKINDVAGGPPPWSGVGGQIQVNGQFSSGLLSALKLVDDQGTAVAGGTILANGYFYALFAGKTIFNLVYTPGVGGGPVDCSLVYLPTPPPFKFF